MSLPPWPELVTQLQVSPAVRVVASMLIEDPETDERLSHFWVKPEDACMISGKFCIELASALHKHTGQFVHIRIEPIESIN